MAEQVVTLRLTANAQGVVTGVQQATGALGGIGIAGRQAGAATEAGMGRARKGVESISTALQSAKQQLLGFFGIAAAAAAVRTIAKLADEYTNLQSRIRLVTDSQQQANAVGQQVFNIAQQTRSELAATGQLYTTLARSTADLGLSQSQLAQITKTVNQSFVVSGASADSARAAITQLAQGLASGALRGDEFNSVAEQAPIIMDVLAKSLGKSRGELREFAAQGGITAKILTDSLLTGAVDVQTQFDGMAVTISGASQQISNAFARFVGETANASGAGSALAALLTSVARNFETIATVALAVGALFGVRLVAQLGASAVAWAANGLQVVAYNASLLRLGATSPVVASGLRLVTGAAVGLSAALGPIALGLAAVTAGWAAFEAAKGPSPLSDYLDALRQTNKELTEQARLQALVASGRATDTTAQSVAALEDANQKVAKARENFEAMQKLMRLLPDTTGLVAAAFAFTSRELDKANSELNELNELTAKNAGLSGNFEKLPKVLRDIATSARDGWRALQQLAGSEPPKFDQSFADQLTKNIATAKAERIEITKGFQARLEYEALLATGAKSVDELDQRMRDLIKTQVSERAAIDAAKTAQQAGNKAREEAIRTAQELLKAGADFRVETVQLAAELEGPAAQAFATYASEIANANDLLLRGGINAADFADRQALALESLNRTTAAIAAQHAPIQDMLDDLRFESELIGLSNTQREIAIALRNIEADAQANGNKLTQDEIAALKARVVAQIEANAGQQTLADTAAQTAEEYRSVWRNATDSVSRAFGDLVTGGIESFKDFGKALRDILRQTLSDMIAMIVRSNVTKALGGLIPGTAVASPGQTPIPGLSGDLSLGTLFGNAGTQVGGSIGSSLFGPGGAQIGGILGGAAQSAAIGSMIGGLFGGAGSTGGAIGGAIGSAIAGPIGAAIGSVLGGAVGSFFGKFKTVSSGVDFTIGDNGATGSAFQNQKKGGVFGKKKRTLTSALDDDAQQAIDDLFAQLTQSLAEAAKTLGVAVPPLVSGSFRQEFDKKGNLKKEFSTIAGRVYNESQQAFAQRLQAENIISLVDSALNLDSLGTAQNEASQIAERWRGSAEKLLAGAQFLLLATTDIRNGFNLLGDATLTDITALVEDLAKAGEPLAQTYARVSVSTQLLEQALDLSGVVLSKTRDEFVRFAVDIADAAGGLDRAQALWSDYFNRFFSDTERAQLALNDALTNAATQFTDINLDASAFTGDGGAEAFRALFEQALPTLSAEAVVEWLEAANAIGLVLDATTALTDSLDATASAAEEAAAALAEQLVGFMANITSQARDAADALADFGLAPLAAGLQQIARDTERAAAEALALGASEEQLAAVRNVGAQQAELLRRQAAAELADLLTGVNTALFELDASPLEIELARIQSAMQNTLAQASALGATEEQLALIRQLGAQQAAQAQATAAEQAREAIEAEADRLRAAFEQIADAIGTLRDRIADDVQSLRAAAPGFDAAAFNAQRITALRAQLAAGGDTQTQLGLIEQIRTATIDRFAAEQRAAEALAQTQAAALDTALQAAEASATAIDAEADRLRAAFEQVADAIAGLRDRITDDVQALRAAAPGFDAAAFAGQRITALRAQLAAGGDAQTQLGLIEQIRAATLDRFAAEQDQLNTLGQLQEQQAADATRRADEQLRAAQQAHDEAMQSWQAQQNAALRLRGFVDNLGLSNVSPLTAFQRFDEAKALFEQAKASGDAEALQSTAQAFLEETRNVFGVSDKAVSIFNDVRGTLGNRADQLASSRAPVFQAPALEDALGSTTGAVIDTTAEIERLRTSAIDELQGLDGLLSALREQEAASNASQLAALGVDAAAARADAASITTAIATLGTDTTAEIERLRTSAIDELQGLDGLLSALREQEAASLAQSLTTIGASTAVTVAATTAAATAVVDQVAASAAAQTTAAIAIDAVETSRHEARLAVLREQRGVLEELLAEQRAGRIEQRADGNPRILPIRDTDAVVPVAGFDGITFDQAFLDKFLVDRIGGNFDADRPRLNPGTGPVREIQPIEVITDGIQQFVDGQVVTTGFLREQERRMVELIAAQKEMGERIQRTMEAVIRSGVRP